MARNGYIDLLRFLFSILVVFYHAVLFGLLKSEHFTNGYIAVEFFLLLSGHFFIKSVERNLCTQSGKKPSNIIVKTVAFLWRKVRPIVVWHVIAIFAMIAIIAYFDKDALLSRVLNGLPNIFLVQMAVFWHDTKDLITPEWYISSMLLTFLWTYPLAFLLLKGKNGGCDQSNCFCSARKWLLPISMLLIAAAFFGAVVLITGGATWHLQQNLRAVGVMALGVVSYYISQVGAVKNVSGSVKAGEEVLTVEPKTTSTNKSTRYFVPFANTFPLVAISFLLVAVVFVFAIFFNHWAFYSLSMLLLFFCVIAISKVECRDSKANKIFIFLGQLSLPIYILHYPIIELLLALIGTR